MIFCKDCRHINFTIHPSGPYCMAPGNCSQVVNYMGTNTEPIQSPKVLNKNNDCNMFEPIKTGFFWRLR
jgi:hypothetical protein